ncbi:phosphate system positive regulatory protein pho81, partial [Cryomyces antarcticus]
MQSRTSSASKLSSRGIPTVQQRPQQTTGANIGLAFVATTDALQQFVEINATAFSKILKKWDKTSKVRQSRTKELYLSRAVEVQPCFNRDVISDLSDQATTNLLDLGAWAEGERTQYTASSSDQVPGAQSIQPTQGEEGDIDSPIVHAVKAGNETLVRDWVTRLGASADARDRVSKVFLNTVTEAPESTLQALLDSDLINLNSTDEINERNCLHKAAISGRSSVLRTALAKHVDVRAVDVYGRIPLHYACIHGHEGPITDLLNAAPDTIDLKDLDNFTPLIHCVVHTRISCVQRLLSYKVRIDPSGPSDHIPLNLACQHGSVPIVDLLLQKRPQILPDAEGLYPQHMIARSGRSPRLLLMLRNYGADLDQRDKLYQWTPLFHAASEGHVECLRTLLQCGVEIDAHDEKGLSAMYYATWEGHLEYMMELTSVGHGSGLTRPSPLLQQTTPTLPLSSMPGPTSMEIEGIPDLSLPPPIIPMRRYGHNFLDTKTFVVISFGEPGSDAVQFYDDSKYPAARLTISSKSSDLIPRNLLLPIQDEFRVISFQIDSLDTFSIDFDIFPTFGSRVIARAIASSKVFSGITSSSGTWHLELFDPRLRAIGRISFQYQVITPFRGVPLEITHFATYWKATSQFVSQPNALITGS